ncbi:MAG: methyltransferase domain-containing protein [Vicinamibacteria bacterium]|nr:methyltransferase domain-containing protein [Vicinamibacteria bacterium]
MNAREEADVETASADYARRFAGPVGTWFLDVQARATLELLAPFPRASVLDVGGGHGQVAEALLAAGHPLTVLGSRADACSATLRPRVDEGRVRFVTADLLACGQPDGAFDVVLSYRLLPHVERWPALIAELCRLARRAVIVDYPTRRSVNAVAEGFFAVKKGVEGNTRPFLVFHEREIADAFAASRFRETARRPQFFFPMALHRGLGHAGVSRALEGAAGALGLRRALGSPVILRCERAAA